MAKKSLILEIKTQAGDAKKGLSEVRQGIVDLFKGTAGAGEKIGSGAGAAFGAMKNALSDLQPEIQALISGATTAVELAEFAGERERLQAKVSGQNLENLRAASMGLADDMTLMRAAASGMTGDFKITEEQMLNVAAAAARLHEDGSLKSVPEIIEQMTHALRTGSVEALKEFGIRVDAGKTKSEQLALAQQKLAEIAGTAGHGIANSGDIVQRSMVELKNAWDDAKESLGKVVAVGLAFTRWVSESIPHLAVMRAGLGYVKDGVDFVTDSMRSFVGPSDDLVTQFKAAQKQSKEAVADIVSFAMQLKYLDELAHTDADSLRDLGFVFQDIGKTIAGTTAELVQFIEWGGDKLEKNLRLLKEVDIAFDLGMLKAKKRQEDAKKAAEARQKAWDKETAALDGWLHREGLRQAAMDTDNALISRQIGNLGDLAHAWREVQFAGTAASQSQIDAILAAQDARGAGAQAAKEESAKWRAEHAHVLSARGALRGLKDESRDALSSLGDTMASTLGAIADGQMSLGAGIQNATHDVMKSLGMRLQGMAFEALGRALMDSFWNPAAAAGEWAAFGVLEAGAAFALGGASLIGTSEPSAKASASRGAGGGGGNTTGRDSVSSGSGGPSVVHNHFHVGWGFFGDERTAAREMERVSSRANAQGTTRAVTGARR